MKRYSRLHRGAKILAHENVLKVMSATPTGRRGDPHDRFIQPKGAWPTETYKDQKTFMFNGETIELYHQANAHSDGDTIVYFRGSNVISGGDIFAISRFSSYDTDGGGSLQGMLSGLNRMVMMSNKDTKLVPGHGRIATQAELIAYRDMSVDIRNQVQALVNKGMTLEQVKAAKPTAKYEPPYGGPQGNTETRSGISTEILQKSDRPMSGITYCSDSARNSRVRGTSLLIGDPINCPALIVRDEQRTIGHHQHGRGPAPTHSCPQAILRRRAHTSRRGFLLPEQPRSDIR